MNGRHGGHGDWDEPRPPCYPPPLIVRERRSIWDVLRGCSILIFLLILIIFLTPLAIIYLPEIIKTIKEFFTSFSLDSIASDVGIRPEFIKFWLLYIVLGLAIGAVIRLLRKI